MRILLVLLMLAITASIAQAQDPAMAAAQQQAMIQTQLDTQTAQQNAQQAMQQAQQTAQSFQQAAQTNFSEPACCIVAAKPKFSVKPGTYDSPQTVKITDSMRGAIIYYTIDGWTPTAASNRYLGPITIRSSTVLQAVAIGPYYAYYGRSFVVSAQYNINAPTGAPPSAAPNPSDSSELAAPVSADEKLTLIQGTPVPFVFSADVSSKTASVGDQIPLLLAVDLKVGNVVVAPKGSAAVALVIQVDKTGAGGAPGELTFQVDSLTVNGTVIKLSGFATKQGEAKSPNAAVLIPVVGAFTVFKHGKDAEIMEGTPFTAFVDRDTIVASLL